MGMKKIKDSETGKISGGKAANLPDSKTPYCLVEGTCKYCGKKFVQDVATGSSGDPIYTNAMLKGGCCGSRECLLAAFKDNEDDLSTKLKNDKGD